MAKEKLELTATIYQFNGSYPTVRFYKDCITVNWNKVVTFRGHRKPSEKLAKELALRAKEVLQANLGVTGAIYVGLDCDECEDCVRMDCDKMRPRQAKAK